MYRIAVHGHVQDNLMKHVVEIFVIPSMLLMVLYERVWVSLLEKKSIKRTFSSNIVSATGASLTMLPSACRSNPCGYGGICVANVSTSANSSYLCQCPAGRFGINCEHGK